MKALGTCAAGVDVEKVVAPVGIRLVGMTRNNNVEAGGFRVKVELLEIVENVNRDVLQFDDLG